MLFAFLPAALGVGYWALLRAYMIAQTVGVTSHVPAGAGVLADDQRVARLQHERRLQDRFNRPELECNLPRR